MAIVFELVINYGLDGQAADEARGVVLAHPPLQAGQHAVRLHEPLLRTLHSGDGSEYREMSIFPVGVGWGVAIDRAQERIQLTASELSELGFGLYALLAGLDRYQVAQVGWEVEWRVDLAELQQEWPDVGDSSGLVLSEVLRPQLPSSSFVPFAPGFVWIPYLGESPSSLTADPQL